jgi:small subunit ribosomal protein S16
LKILTKNIPKNRIYLLLEGDRSMVRLRLRRIGAKKQPSYRIVAADKESPRDGRFLEALGNYNPRTEPATISLKEDRIFHWLSVGAQPSEAVERLFKQMGTYERYARFKDGEDIEKLVEEYAEVDAARNVDPRTRRDDLVGAKKKAEKAEEEV